MCWWITSTVVNTVWKGVWQQMILQTSGKVSSVYVFCYECEQHSKKRWPNNSAEKSSGRFIENLKSLVFKGRRRYTCLWPSERVFTSCDHCLLRLSAFRKLLLEQTEGGSLVHANVSLPSKRICNSRELYFSSVTFRERIYSWAIAGDMTLIASSPSYKALVNFKRCNSRYFQPQFSEYVKYYCSLQNASLLSNVITDNVLEICGLKLMEFIVGLHPSCMKK